nr:hypothetical protein [Tanacetum cinerariifolium]
MIKWSTIEIVGELTRLEGKEEGNDFFTVGAVIPTNHQLGQNTTPPLLVDQSIPEKTDHQLEVEVEDPKTVVPLHSYSDAANDETHNALEDEHHVSLHSPHESANEFVHNFVNIDDDKRKDSPPHLKPFVNLSRKPINADDERVFSFGSNAEASSQRLNRPYPSQYLPTSGQNVEEGKSSRSAAISIPNWGIPHRCRMDTLVWFWELMVHLAFSAAQEESNALTN